MPTRRRATLKGVMLKRHFLPLIQIDQGKHPLPMPLHYDRDTGFGGRWRSWMVRYSATRQQVGSKPYKELVATGGLVIEVRLQAPAWSPHCVTLRKRLPPEWTEAQLLTTFSTLSTEASDIERTYPIRERLYRVERDLTPETLKVIEDKENTNALAPAIYDTMTEEDAGAYLALIAELQPELAARCLLSRPPAVSDQEVHDDHQSG